MIVRACFAISFFEQRTHLISTAPIRLTAQRHPGETAEQCVKNGANQLLHGYLPMVLWSFDSFEFSCGGRTAIFRQAADGSWSVAF